MVDVIYTIGSKNDKFNHYMTVDKGPPHLKYSAIIRQWKRNIIYTATASASFYGFAKAFFGQSYRELAGSTFFYDILNSQTLVPGVKPEQVLTAIVGLFTLVGVAVLGSRKASIGPQAGDSDPANSDD